MSHQRPLPRVSVIQTVDSTTVQAADDIEIVSGVHGGNAFVAALRQARGEFILLAINPGQLPVDFLAHSVQYLQSNTDACALIATRAAGLPAATAGLEPAGITGKESVGRMFASLDKLWAMPEALLVRKDSVDADLLQQHLQTYNICLLARQFLLLFLLNPPARLAELFLGDGVADAHGASQAALVLESATLFDAACRYGYLKDIKSYAQTVRNLYNWVSEAALSVSFESKQGQLLKQRADLLESILAKFSRMGPVFNGLAEYSCPACQHKVINFAPLPQAYLRELAAHGYRYALDDHETFNVAQYYCPVCNATDYERMYALHLRHLAQNAVETGRLLHIGPSPALKAFIHSLGVFDQRTADLYRQDVDDQLDIVDMSRYADNSFDCFVCSMVLEHVADDRAALAELYRVTRAGGWGILMVPIIPSLLEIDEETAPTAASTRWQRFGHSDHLRVYSRQGFLQRVRAAGFTIEARGAETFGQDVFRRAGIGLTSVLYLVRKPVADSVLPAIPSLDLSS